MTSIRQTGRTFLLLLSSGFALPGFAQEAVPKPPIPAKKSTKASQTPTNLSLIVLDAGHGGDDAGAHLADGSLEKDQALVFALRLRPLLEAKGFTVILSREPDASFSPNGASTLQEGDDVAPHTSPPVPTEDQRAEQANRVHPLACLMIHATSAGHGVHLFTSALTPPDLSDTGSSVLSWNEAQASKVPQSLRLANALSAALNGIRVPLLMSRASVPPIDSLTCPAVALELAPLPAMGGRNLPPSDPDYQLRVAQALAGGIAGWRSETEAEIAHAQAEADAAAAKGAEPPAKKPKPKPKPIVPDIPGVEL